MNKIFKYALVAIAGLGLCSCEDVLDQKPLDSFTDDAVWGDLALSQTYLNNSYAEIKGETGKGSYFASYIDECFQMHTYGTENVTQSLLSPDNAGINWDDMWRAWNTYYDRIAEINLFLEHIDAVPGDEATRNNQKGQALFLRAWNYHILYLLYGRVVKVDHTYELDHGEFTEKRADLDDVADFIVKDLDEAASLLPVSQGSAGLGQATKGAALALKSRVLLYKASPLFSPNHQPTAKRWEAAADAAKAVIDMGVYSLKPVSNADEYSKLFFDPENPEVIWERLADPKGGTGWYEAWQMDAPCGPGNGFNGWGAHAATQNIVEKFEMADGSKPVIPADGNYGNTKPWEGREIRLAATILCDGDMWGYGEDRREVEFFYGPVNGKDSQWGDYWWNAVKTCYAIRKFLDPSYDMNGTDQPSTPFFFLRLAEVYLNYAEAEIELGNNAEAAKYINLIRHRALLPDFTGDIREAYDYERQIELLFEGQRWVDQRRWMRMDKEYSVPIYGVSIYKDENGVKTYTVDKSSPVSTRKWGGDKYYWLPIPRAELNKCPLLDGQPYED